MCKSYLSYSASQRRYLPYSYLKVFFIVLSITIMIRLALCLRILLFNLQIQSILPSEEQSITVQYVFTDSNPYK